MDTLQAELVARGTTFDEAYLVSSLCSPSRASYWKGQYAWNTGVDTNLNDGALDSDNTYLRWFHDAGYLSLVGGKYGNSGNIPVANDGTITIPAGIDWCLLGSVKQNQSDFGYDFYFKAPGVSPVKRSYGTRDPALQTPQSDPSYGSQGFDITAPVNPNPTGAGYRSTDTDHREDVLRLEMLNALKTIAHPSGKPWILDYRPTVPHRGSTAPWRYTNTHSAKKVAADNYGVSPPITPPAAFMETNDTLDGGGMRYKPSFIATYFNNGNGTPNVVTADYWQGVSRQIALQAVVDDWLFDLIAWLKATDDPRWPGHKLYENTIIVYAADNGEMEGEHWLKGNSSGNGAKEKAYEPSLRTPLFISGPGFTQKNGDGSYTPLLHHDFVFNIDLAPTLVKAANAQGGGPLGNVVPSGRNPVMDGIAIGDAPAGRVVCLDNFGAAPQGWCGAYAKAADGKRWKYTSWGPPGPNPIAEEFYEINGDPDELYNLIDVTSTPDGNGYYALRTSLVTARGYNASAVATILGTLRNIPRKGVSAGGMNDCSGASCNVHL